MRQVLRIFSRDCRRIAKRPFAVIVLIGIMVIPSLYAWFNIKACWDPYGNTQGIAVAVANTDEGRDIAGVSVNVGGMIVDNLAKNDQIGWKFMKKDEALDGVQSGKYYAAVIIPEDFSQKIGSVLTLDMEKPQIEYYVNQKKNAIAPKITDKGVGVIQQQVNETFISTVTEVVGTVLADTDEQLGETQNRAVDSVVEKLQDVSGSLDEFSVSITAFKEASLAVSGVLDATENALPAINGALDDTAAVGSDVQEVILSSKTLSAQVTESAAQILDAASETTNSIDKTLEKAFGVIDSDTQTAAGLLDEGAAQCDTVLTFNKQMIELFNNLSQKLPVAPDALTRAVQALEDVNTKIEEMSGKLTQAGRTLREAGSLPAQTREELQDSFNEAKTAMDRAANLYRTQAKPALDQLLDDVYQQVGSVSSLLASAGSAAPDLTKSIDGMNGAITHTVNALDSVQTLIQSAKDKIDEIVTELQSVTGDERMEKLLELIRRDPSLTAGFLSAPVQINTTNLYDVENYGSAMTPFYTVLCLWVGAVILVAILKCQVREEDAHRLLRPSEAYFGRYLLFLAVGIGQALIVCLGDLYLLKIQCTNKPLFLLAGVLTSVVFTNIVYTLTISFGDVGKAIAVILLVLQVAGAGGTFPIEVMPEFFQRLNPLLPFTYGINAMRETVAGMYGNAYWVDIAKLLLYLPISLFIGLVLRKPLIRANHYLESKLEETGVM